jgi:Caspase domain
MNRSLSALYSVMLIASAFIATVVVPTRVDAGTIYVGIGENDLDPQGPADIMASVGAISPYVPAGNIIAATGAITPATIVANLTAGVGMTKPGDVLIFQYAGHGNPVTDPGDLNDPTIPATSDTGVEVPHADEQIGLMTDLNAGTGVTDDQLTSILAKVPAGATAYAILDSCFSGWRFTAIVAKMAILPRSLSTSLRQRINFTAPQGTRYSSLYL